MKRVNIKNYKKEYVCYINDYDEIELIGSDDLATIKEMIEDGYTIYGTSKYKVFKEDFIEEIKNKFECYAEDYGYPDMNDDIDYDSEAFKKVKESIQNFIESLGGCNNIYDIDKNTVIEVDR